jgi:hypothetical protein
LEPLKASLSSLSSYTPYYLDLLLLTILYDLDRQRRLA